MTSNKPKITLKGLKIAKFASEETLCYEATVYVDGKAFCIASNQGHGGSDSYDTLRPRGGFKTGEEAGKASRALDKAIEEVAARFNPNAVKSYDDVPKNDAPLSIDDWDRHMAEDVVTLWSVFEHLVGNALTRAQYEKDLKRLLLRRAVFINDENVVSNTKQVPKAHWENGKFLDTMRARFPEEKLLNDLPFDEALDLFMAAV